MKVGALDCSVYPCPIVIVGEKTCSDLIDSILHPPSKKNFCEVDFVHKSTRDSDSDDDDDNDRANFRHGNELHSPEA